MELLKLIVTNLNLDIILAKVFASVFEDNNKNFVNIKEKNYEKFVQFSLTKESIYFKFLPLRMKNRCENTSPIALTEVILATN